MTGTTSRLAQGHDIDRRHRKTLARAADSTTGAMASLLWWGVGRAAQSGTAAGSSGGGGGHGSGSWSSASCFFFQQVSQSCESQAGSDYHRSADSSRSAQPAKLKQQPTNFKLTLRIPTPTSNRKARLGAVLSLPGRRERTGTPAARPTILL